MNGMKSILFCVTNDIDSEVPEDLIQIYGMMHSRPDPNLLSFDVNNI